jgi:Glu-tRNA(Gln) amidotransferase subunit E-like FAD-binding protein
LEFTEAFKKSNCRFLKKAECVIAERLPLVDESLDKNKNGFLARSLCEEVKKINDVGFVCTDELPGYGITKKEVNLLRKKLKASKGVIAITAGDKKQSENAMRYLQDLSKKASFPNPSLSKPATQKTHHASTSLGFLLPFSSFRLKNK